LAVVLSDDQGGTAGPVSLSLTITPAG
jgi:hypothetical protein